MRPPNLLTVEKLAEILDDIQQYKLDAGYPKDKQDAFACPYERLGKTGCETKDWGGYGRLNTLLEHIKKDHAKQLKPEMVTELESRKKTNQGRRRQDEEKWWELCVVLNLIASKPTFDVPATDRVLKNFCRQIYFLDFNDYHMQTRFCLWCLNRRDIGRVPFIDHSQQKHELGDKGWGISGLVDHARKQLAGQFHGANGRQADAGFSYEKNSKQKVSADSGYESGRMDVDEDANSLAIPHVTHDTEPPVAPEAVYNTGAQWGSSNEPRAMSILDMEDRP